MMKGILLPFILMGTVLAQTAPKPLAKPATITVTDLDRTKIENLGLKISILETEISVFVTKFERDYPGWTVNVKTGQVYQKPEPIPPVKK